MHKAGDDDQIVQLAWGESFGGGEGALMANARVCGAQPEVTLSVGDRCPPPFRALIERCCAFKPHNRPKIAEVISVLEAMDTADLGKRRGGPPNFTQRTFRLTEPTLLSAFLCLEDDSKDGAVDRGKPKSVHAVGGTPQLHPCDVLPPAVDG